MTISLNGFDELASKLNNLQTEFLHHLCRLKSIKMNALDMCKNRMLSNIYSEFQ